MHLVGVVGVERPTPNLARITLAGDGIGRLASCAGDHVTVYFPAAPGVDPVLPGRFDLRRGGTDRAQPIAREYTPQFVDDMLRLDLVLHGCGPASRWAAEATVGERVGLAPGSGPRMPAPTGSQCVLIGDDSALPALRRVLAELPGDVVADVFVEVTGLEDMQALGTDAMAMVRWVPRRGQPHGAPLVAAVRQAALRLDGPGRGDVSVWVSAEATATRALRSYFVDERGVAPSRMSCRDSWVRRVVEHRRRRAG